MYENSSSFLNHSSSGNDEAMDIAWEEGLWGMDAVQVSCEIKTFHPTL